MLTHATAGAVTAVARRAEKLKPVLRSVAWQLPGPGALARRLCDNGVGFGLSKLQLPTMDSGLS